MTKIDAADAAINAVSGPVWQLQLKEERRIDPATGEARNRTELYRGYSKGYTHQEIVGDLGSLEVFKLQNIDNTLEQSKSYGTNVDIQSHVPKLPSPTPRDDQGRKNELANRLVEWHAQAAPPAARNPAIQAAAPSSAEDGPWMFYSAT